MGVGHLGGGGAPPPVLIARGACCGLRPICLHPFTRACHLAEDRAHIGVVKQTLLMAVFLGAEAGL